MSGHSKFANIKHKKEKMMLQREKFLRELEEKLRLQLKKAEQIQRITVNYVM